MPSPSRTLRSAALVAFGLTAVGQVGCRGVEGDVEISSPPEPRAPNVGFATVPHGDGLRLTLAAGGDAATLVTSDGVRLVVEGPDGPVTHDLPFVEQHKIPRGLELECAPAGEHRITVQLENPTPGRFRVVVRDRIDLRSRMLEAMIAYRFNPGSPFDEVEGPHPQPTAASTAGDGAFRSPVAYLRRGNRAFGLLPDLWQLQQTRRVPEAIEVDASTGTIRHGWCAHRTEAGPTGVPLFTRAGAEPVPVAGESLAFGHTLRLTETAAPRRTAARFHDELWRTRVEPPRRSFENREAPRPRHERVESILTAALVDYRESTIAGTTVGGLPTAGADSWFAFIRQSLRTAAGFCGLGTEPATRSAAGLVNLIASAPQPGLLPSRFEQTDRTLVWHPGPAGDEADDYRVFDSATTGYWLIELAARLPEQRERILAICRRLASCFIENQAASRDGGIPGRFDAEFLTPVTRATSAADAAAMAMFLASYAQAADDDRAANAARRAIEHVVATDLTDWSDPETGATPDPRTGAPPAGVFGPIFAARAAATLVDLTGSPRMAKLTGEFCDELFRHQQVWSPAWMPGELRGGFAAPRSVTWSDPRGALAAEVLADGYRVTGRRDLLERSAAALRASIGRDDCGYDPTRARPADATWGPVVAATVATRIWKRYGHGVVDVARSFAASFDEFWFEDLVVTTGRIEFALLTHAEFAEPVRITFDDLPATASAFELVVNGASAGTHTAEQLGRGVALAPARVPEVTFSPPPEIRRNGLWRPRAWARGPLDGVAVTVEVESRGTVLARVAMQPATVPPGRVATGAQLLLADRALTAAELQSPTGELSCRLVVGRRSGGIITATSPSRVRLGEFDTIDAGEGDLLELTEDSRSSVVRFVDGREFARAARGDEKFTYALELGGVAAVDLRIALEGAVRITAGGQLVFHDEVATQRVVEFRLSDPRLWRDGPLTLSFEPADRTSAGIRIARVYHAVLGQTTSIPTLTETTTSAADPEVRVLIVPLPLSDAPLLAGTESLRQVFFGDADYHQTPPPEPRFTTGSVAVLLEELSGGISSLTGEVLLAQPAELVGSDLVRDPDAGAREIYTALVPGLRPRLESGEVDAIVIVYGGKPLEGRLDGGHLHVDDTDGVVASGGLPWVFMAERSADGSLLACGHALSSLLRGLGRTIPVDTPERGNFGKLALGGGKSDHTPPGLLGLNMVRAGWADSIRLQPAEQLDPSRFDSKPLRLATTTLSVSPLRTGRTLFQLPCDQFVDRGVLSIESRAGSNPTPYESAGGVLMYWHFPHARPLLIAGDRACRAEILRLSPRWTTTAAPFVEGSGEDLLFRAATLDGVSSPSLATPQGELVWRVRNLGTSGQAIANLDLEYRPVNLLTSGVTTWQAGSVGQVAPLLVREDPTDGTSVSDGGAGYRVTAEPRHVVRGRFTLPRSDEHRRLFFRLENIDCPGAGHVHLRTAEHGVLTILLDRRQRAAFGEADLPPIARPTTLTVEIRADTGIAATVSQLAVVPIAQPTHAGRLRVPEAHSVRLQDGVVYGTTRPVRIGPKGTAKIATMVVLPAGDIALHLRAGLASAEVDATASLGAQVRGFDASWRVAVFDGVVLGPAGDRRTPLLTAKAAVAGARPGVAVLELTVTGTPGATVHIIDVGFQQG